MEPNTINLSNEHLTRMVNSLMGEVAACRVVITTLIASHPNPDIVQRIWNQSKPEWVDGMDEKNVFQHPDYRSTYIGTLSAFSQSVDEAENVSRP